MADGRAKGSPAASTKARETGCRLPWAKAAARASAWGAVTPSRTSTRSRAKASRVKVPVLSNTTRSTCDSASRACKRRTKVPCRARAPALASIAAGVASDRAQGQVTTKMATAIIKACPGSVRHHQAQARPAASSTQMRNGLAKRSAKVAMCGLLVEACAINATIWA